MKQDKNKCNQWLILLWCPKLLLASTLYEKPNYIFIWITTWKSDSMCVGPFDVPIALIKDPLIIFAALKILIKTCQEFTQDAVINCQEWAQEGQGCSGGAHMYGLKFGWLLWCQNINYTHMLRQYFTQMEKSILCCHAKTSIYIYCKFIVLLLKETLEKTDCCSRATI